MKHRCSHRRILAAAVAGALVCGAGFADDQVNMMVTANVDPSCALSAVTDLDFGDLVPTADNDADTTITWVCTNGTDTQIELNGGGSGDINARAMAGAGALPYQLYTDAARTSLFGDGTTGNAVSVSGAGYGTPQDVTIYGRVLQADAAAAANGAYTDTVQVTIRF